jgi:hypothetical protein
MSRTPSANGNNPKALNDYVSNQQSTFRSRLLTYTVATGRLVREGSVWPGVSYVVHGWARIVTLTIGIGALNWATGETVAVKEIQLANIPKAELSDIMVRLMDHAPALDRFTYAPHKSEIDLLKNLNVCV